MVRATVGMKLRVREGVVLGLVALTGCSRPASTTPPQPAASGPEATPSPSDPVVADAPSSEAPPPEAADDPAPAEVTLIGEWVGDASCVPQMAGMENADEATVEAVGAQIAANRFTFAEDTVTQEIGPTKAEQPYKVLAHEGATWSIEMNGPTGQPQRTELELSGTTLRMTRDGALVICLRRP